MDWDFISPHWLRPYKTLGGVARNNSGYWRLDGDVGGYVWRQITGDRIHQKLNKMRLLLGPILGKMVQLLPFLYITPTVSFATLFEPILKMARPPNNWHSAFIIRGTCCQFDNKTILRRERLSSHCPASLFVCDTNRQQLETLSSSTTHHASQI